MSLARKHIGARELKTRLGRYLRLVQRGARIVVTDRGRPIAELAPLPPEASGIDAALDVLAARGELTRATVAELAEFEPTRVKGRPLSDTVADEREDRF